MWAKTFISFFISSLNSSLVDLPRLGYPRHWRPVYPRHVRPVPPASVPGVVHIPPACAPGVAHIQNVHLDQVKVFDSA